MRKLCTHKNVPLVWCVWRLWSKWRNEKKTIQIWIEMKNAIERRKSNKTEWAVAWFMLHRKNVIIFLNNPKPFYITTLHIVVVYDLIYLIKPPHTYTNQHFIVIIIIGKFIFISRAPHSSYAWIVNCFICWMSYAPHGIEYLSWFHSYNFISTHTTIPFHQNIAG